MGKAGEVFKMFYSIFHTNAFKFRPAIFYMDAKEMMKRAFIAGASCAIDYKERNPRASESEIMSHTSGEMRRLLREIEKD